LTGAQLRQAHVLPIRLYLADQSAVDIPFVPFHDDRLPKGELRKVLSRCLVMRLLSLGGVDAGEPDPVFLPPGVEDGQRIAVSNLHHLAADGLGGQTVSD
jgi:hypothetical protein